MAAILVTAFPRAVQARYKEPVRSWVRRTGTAEEKVEPMEFCVLGGLEVRSARAPLALGGRKPRTVLAMLLLHADTTVSVDRLVDAVWPGSAPASAAKNVQTYVWALRRVLTDDEGPRIVTRLGGYQLLLRPGELDLREFERLSEEGRRLRPIDPEAAGALLRDALALWHGPLLPDLSGDISEIATEATRVDELREVTVEERVEADLALGRHADLVVELSSLIAAQPLRERLRGQHMRALHRSGRRADALASYQDLKERLDDELGIRPGAQLQRLYQAVLCSDTVTDTVAPATRLVPAQLPPDTVAFTGREEQLRQLDSAACSVVMVVGSPGVGKTSLAVHWAHRVRDRFPDGQLYANLRGSTAPVPAGQVLAWFLRALGVGAEQVPVHEDEAAAQFRSRLANRRMLVVLDDAATADQVRPLLPGNPACVVVVTSRSRLTGVVARDGARPLAVDVLSRAEAGTLLRSLLDDERVAAEPDAAEELAQACGFLPLALRIAAAHLATRPHRALADYVAELRSDRLAALRVDGDPESEVSVAFDQSYQALDPDTRRLFRLLSLAPGPDVTAQAAAALANQSAASTSTQLDRLVAVHMISESAGNRFAMHDLLRLYGRQRADMCGDKATRLFSWYADMAASAVGVLYPQLVRLPSHDVMAPADPLAWLDTERSNLVAAATAEDAGQAAWRLADALRGYFRLRRTGIDWLAVARAGVAAADDEQASAAAHLSLGDAYWSTGRHEEAQRCYRQALADATAAEWVPGMAAVLTNLGTLHWETGSLTAATECYTAALAHNRAGGLLGGQAANLNNLGMVHRQLGRLDEAVECYRKALATHEEAGSRVGAGNALANLGVVCRLLGRLDEAEAKFAEGLVIQREFGSRAGEAQVLADLAEVRRLRGQPADAVPMLTEALAVQCDIGHDGGRATTLYLLALAHRDLGDQATALRHARKSAELATERGNRRCAALALTLAATLEPDRAVAEAAHAEALTLARSSGSVEAEADALVGWAETALRGGAASEAHRLASAALALAQPTGHQALADRAQATLAALD